MRRGKEEESQILYKKAKFFLRLLFISTWSLRPQSSCSWFWSLCPWQMEPNRMAILYFSWNCLGYTRCITTTIWLLMSMVSTVFENHSTRRIWFWHFPPFFVLLNLTCLVTMFDCKLQVFKNSPKLVWEDESNFSLHCIRSHKLYKTSFIKAQLFENHRKSLIFKHCKRTSYVYILKVQKFIKNAKSGPFRRVLENLKLEVK